MTPSEFTVNTMNHLGKAKTDLTEQLATSNSFSTLKTARAKAYIHKEVSGLNAGYGVKKQFRTNMHNNITPNVRCKEDNDDSFHYNQDPARVLGFSENRGTDDRKRMSMF